MQSSLIFLVTDNSKKSITYSFRTNVNFFELEINSQNIDIKNITHEIV
jgi:hypothetical protein